MNSSTSPSKSLFWVLIGSLAISYTLGAAYTLWVNPEIRFWKAAYDVKVQHARTLDAAGVPKTVFVGGSSCAFQIDPKILEGEFGIPSVNMGMHAGMGARAILALALPHLKPGDRLVLNMEPHLLSADLAPTPLGLQILAATGNWDSLSSLPSSASFGVTDILLALRPGLRNVVTMLGKVVARRPLYRYSISDIHSGGFLTTQEKGAKAIDGSSPRNLSSPAESFLTELHIFSNEKQIDARYLLPWICSHAETSGSARTALELFAARVGKFLPEIRDGQSGVDSQLNDFADTPLHLTREGATRRTKVLSSVLDASANN